MSSLAIIGISVGGAFTYCLIACYVYMRVIWYMRQSNSYNTEEKAFLTALFLPFGLAMLCVYSIGSIDRDGIPPRSVRREQELEHQRDKIARLERELDLR